MVGQKVCWMDGWTGEWFSGLSPGVGTNGWSGAVSEQSHSCPAQSDRFQADIAM